MKSKIRFTIQLVTSFSSTMVCLIPLLFSCSDDSAGWATGTCYAKSLNLSGSKNGEYVYHYDQNNRLLTCDFTSGGSTTEEQYVYDANGNVIEVKNWVQGVTVISFEFAYDASNYVIGITFKNSLGTITGNQVLIYNDFGQLITRRILNAIGDPLSRWDYTYENSTSMNPEIAKEFQPGGSLLRSVEYSFDDKPAALTTSTSYIISGMMLARMIDGNAAVPLFGTNNPTQIVRKDGAGSVTSTITLSYQYNADRYPESITVSGGLKCTFQYDCD